MVKMKNYAALVALSEAEREPIRHTVHGYSVCTFDGRDFWAYTPKSLRPEPIADPSPETTALIARLDRDLTPAGVAPQPEAAA